MAEYRDGMLDMSNTLTHVSSGGQTKEWGYSAEADQGFSDMLKELKIMNLHLQFISDNEITSTEVG